MEWYQILGLCLSCFSLGLGLTGLFYTLMTYKSTDDNEKRK